MGDPMKRRVWTIYTFHKGWFRFFADNRADAEYHCECLKADGWLLKGKPKMIGWEEEGTL